MGIRLSKLPLCGHGLKGFGCGKPIERVEDLFRCVDCKMPFHQICCVMHFGDGRPHEVEGRGKVTEHRMSHAFAFETAYLVGEVLKRDAEIERLKSLQPSNP